MRTAGRGGCILKATLWLVAGGVLAAAEKDDSRPTTERTAPPQVPAFQDPSWRISCERVRTKRTSGDDVISSSEEYIQGESGERPISSLGGIIKTRIINSKGPHATNNGRTQELPYNFEQKSSADGQGVQGLPSRFHSTVDFHSLYPPQSAGHIPSPIMENNFASVKEGNRLMGSPTPSFEYRSPPGVVSGKPRTVRLRNGLQASRAGESAEDLIKDAIRVAETLKNKESLRLPVKSLDIVKMVASSETFPSSELKQKVSDDQPPQMDAEETGGDVVDKRDPTSHKYQLNANIPPRINHHRDDTPRSISPVKNTEDDIGMTFDTMSRSRRTSSKEGGGVSPVEGDRIPKGKDRSGRQKGKSGDKQGRKNKGRRKPVEGVSGTATLPTDDLEKELIAVAEKSNKRRKGKKPGSKSHVNVKTPSRMHQHMEHKKKVRDWLQRRVQEQINQRRMRRNLIM